MPITSNLNTVTLNTSDIEIGAVEIKNATTDDRASVDASGRLLSRICTTSGGSIALGGGAESTAVLVTIANDSTGKIATVESTASSATVTQVASSATNVTLKASNGSRKKLSVFNDSTQVLYLKFGATASSTSYTVKMAAGAYWEMPFPAYTGIVDGIWASANGNAYVTEY